MREEKTRLEGKVTSVELTGDKDRSHGPKEIPYVKFSIKNVSGKREFVLMSMDIGDGQLIKKAMLGQTVVYEIDRSRVAGYIYFTTKLSIKSGQCAGVKYQRTEEY